MFSKPLNILALAAAVQLVAAAPTSLDARDLRHCTKKFDDCEDGLGIKGFCQKDFIGKGYFCNVGQTIIRIGGFARRDAELDGCNKDKVGQTCHNAIGFEGVCEKSFGNDNYYCSELGVFARDVKECTKATVGQKCEAFGGQAGTCRADLFDGNISCTPGYDDCTEAKQGEKCDLGNGFQGTCEKDLVDPGYHCRYMLGVA